MSLRGSTDLDYTWYGVLVTDCDALLVLEKCLRGELAHIPRRPHDSERARLIKSGSIFVYESNASGIKRWTDGINWSPSRILTNFLVYHELEKAPPPGEKKRAIKRKRSETDLDDHDPKAAQRAMLEEEWTDDDRRLMGSPQDNYGWKAGGLVKKTYSFDFRGASHHIISYFNPEDVRSGELKRPIHCEAFQKTFIRPELIEQGARSRNPITEAQIEQQRWERPLYQNDSSVSLMGQYPIPQNVSFPNAGQIMDYPSSHKHTISQPHALMHRSSIHFPMEESVYHSNTTPTGYPQPMAPNAMHARHASMSGPVSEGFQRPQLREHIARAVPTIDTSVESTYQTPTSAVPHPQSQRSLNQSPIDVKSGSVFEGEEGGEPAYVPISQARAGYSVVTSPSLVTPIDTSYSHSIARPTLFHAPHTTSHIHDTSGYYASSSISGPPPAKRGRIETSYQNPHFHSPVWDRSISAPVTAADIPVTQQIPFEPMPFQAAPPFTAHHGYGYSYAPDHAPYDIGPDFGGTQAPGMYGLQGFSSQLTAPS